MRKVLPGRVIVPGIPVRNYQDWTRVPTTAYRHGKGAALEDDFHIWEERQWTMIR
jgi:hypothetical protein